MTTVVLKGIGMRMLRDQMNALIELENKDPDNFPSGIFDTLDQIIRNHDDNKTLEDCEVEKMLDELKILLAVCGFNDMSTKAQDRALAKAIQFISCQPFPEGRI